MWGLVGMRMINFSVAKSPIQIDINRLYYRLTMANYNEYLPTRRKVICRPVCRSQTMWGHLAQWCCRRFKFIARKPFLRRWAFYKSSLVAYLIAIHKLRECHITAHTSHDNITNCAESTKQTGEMISMLTKRLPRKRAFCIVHVPVQNISFHTRLIVRFVA